jgi:ABC-2 type transport system permease protein
VTGARAGRPPSLLALRARAWLRSVRRAPVRHAVAGAFLGGAAWGIAALVERGVRWVDGYPLIGTIADAALQRSVEAFVTLLALGVAFSVLTSAVTTLYTAHDLPLLLSWPLPVGRVFGLKVFETYLGSALLPAALTVPVLVGLGVARGAPWVYYPVATVAVLALYALPVAFGAAAALGLMRVAPAGRVKEVSTAASVVVAAGLVLALRAFRPEQLAELTPEEFEVFLTTFAALDLGAWPPGWAGATVWAALDGRVAPALVPLLLGTAAALGALAWGAARAYQAGWLRGLDPVPRRRDPRPRGAAPWERPFGAFGAAGALVVKDLRLLARDPTQGSQLLVLVALAGVYLVSTASIEVDGQRFRDALGALNVAFLGLLLAGVGVRIAFPLVSLEGEGWWFVRTAPMRARAIVAAKLAHALPPLLVLGIGLGVAQALLLDVSANLATAAALAGACAAVAVAALGVGLGAAFPRFDATQATEVPLSPGGLLYMTTALGYAVGLTVVLAYPAWTTLVDPTLPVWATAAGRLTIAAAVAWTALFAGPALAFGTWRLERFELGRDG